MSSSGPQNSVQHQPQLTKLSHNRALPKWSFGGRFRDSELTRKVSPGPGAYGASESSTPRKPKSAAGAFGSSPRDFTIRLAPDPGPGQYAIHDASARSSPRYTFGGVGRAAMAPATPGPGSYAAAASDGFTRRASPLYSLAPRREEVREEEARVAPCARLLRVCASRETKERTAAWGVANDSRAFRPNTNPGPGEYEVAQRVDGPSYSMQERRGKGGPLAGISVSATQSGSFTQFGY
mmetsp:Transcript_77885/g.218272  ORF Transcript_77885/g.218272 Transcript_77885/m.218272 type:complete len:237 (+) Transcript_77885:107-817(+)